MYKALVVCGTAAEIGVVTLAQAAFVGGKGVRETIPVHAVHIGAHAGEQSRLAVAAHVAGIAPSLAHHQHLAHRVKNDGVVVVFGLHGGGQRPAVGQLVVGIEAAGGGILAYQALKHRHLGLAVTLHRLAAIRQHTVHLRPDAHRKAVVGHHRRNARRGPVQHLDALPCHVLFIRAHGHQAVVPKESRLKANPSVI